MSQKQCLSGQDITALVSDYQALVGSRVNNVYDIKSGVICIKLIYETGEIVDGIKVKERKYLIIDSGKKMYLSNRTFTAIRKIPTSFVAKLRELNNKRISAITQVRRDRVVDFHIGEGEYTYHLIAEFYASGNIVLTDKNYKILIVFHPHTYTDEKAEKAKIRVSVNNIYPFDYATTDFENVKVTGDEVRAWILDNVPKISKKQTVKQFMSRSPLAIYGPVLIEHALISLGVNPKSKLGSVTPENEVDNIFDRCYDDLADIVRILYMDTNTFSGYLIRKDGLFSNVVPVLYNQYSTLDNIRVGSFSEATSFYFSSIDVFDQKNTNDKVKKKVDRNDDERIEKSINEQIEKLEENNIKIKKKINGLEERMDDLNLLLHYAKVENDVESIRSKLVEDGVVDIVPTKLEKYKKEIQFEYSGKNYIWNIEKSAYANFTNMWSASKGIVKKQNRARDALTKAKNSKRPPKDEKWKTIEIPGKQKKLWYEEFIWFYSSDGFLVICGKTADQNETIVKNYMRKYSVYIHSNVAGSGSCIVYNEIDKEIPQRTLDEAGACVICHTRAWKDHSPDKTWWVKPDQVSKTAPTGEYVGKGSFIIRGTKNMLHQPNLRMGLSLLFKNTDSETLSDSGGEKTEWCIPVCAPYSAVSKNKFKVKLVPGNMKIGRTLKEIKSIFFANGNDYEKAAIRKVPDDDYHRVLISNIKLLR